MYSDLEGYKWNAPIGNYDKKQTTEWKGERKRGDDEDNGN